MHNSRADLFGLLETKIKKGKAHHVSLNLCNGWSFTTNIASHHVGRIWFLWKSQIYEISIEYV